VSLLAVSASLAFATRVDTAPVIDGVLADPVWQSAPPISELLQRRPTPGAPAGESTELRVLYGNGALYVGMRMRDGVPGLIRGVLGRRDSQLPSDSVTIYLDPLDGGQVAYFFTINAAGVLADGIVYNQTELDRSWDAAWTGAARIDADGWSAELAIPLAALPLQDAAEQQWGFYAERFVNRTQEVSSWPAMPPGGNAFVSRFGTLTQLHHLARATRLRVQPYAAGVLQLRAPANAPPTARTFRPNAGIDLQYNATPSLRLVLAANPDFGEVDQDPEVVNLTAEETFLDERRSFFAAGLDLFRTPTPPAQGRFVFLNTRRIGASVPPLVPSKGASVIEADPQRRILGALKVLGEAGRDTSYGAISVVEEAARGLETRLDPISGRPRVVERDLLPTTHYGVLRVLHRLGPRSYAGALGTTVHRIGETATRVQPSGEVTADTDAYVGVADWQLREASGRQLAGFLSAARSRHGFGVAGFLQAGQLGFREWIYKAELELYSSDYDLNDAGFLRRSDHMQAVLRVDRQLVAPWGMLQRGNVALTTIQAHGFADPRQVQRRFFRLNAGGTTRRNLVLETTFGVDLPRVDPIETRGGPLFPRPRALRSTAELRTSASRPVWATWTSQLDLEERAWSASSQLTGSALALDRWTISVLLGWRVNRGTTFYVDTIRDQGLPRFIAGDLDFDEQEVRVTSTLGLTRHLTLQTFAQALRAIGHYRRYRELIEDAGGSVRFADTEYAGGLDFARLGITSNTVLRYEVGGGTAVVVGYRASASLARTGDAAPFALREGLDRLSNERFVQQLLLKISYAWDAL
jgi:hypothetical protein